MKQRIGVLMGGFTSERHISLESGRNICSKLMASTQYEAIPLFLTGSIHTHRLFILPTALLLKDNADDIHHFLLYPAKFKSIEACLLPIRQETYAITQAYAKKAIFSPEEITYARLKEWVDFIFIALHGRPGEDGTLQRMLEAYDIPYNGSGIHATALTIDKYATNQFLAKEGFHTAEQYIITKKDWEDRTTELLADIADRFTYPLIAKPIDDGCSSGVIKIENSAMLVAYAAASFRAGSALMDDLCRVLRLMPAHDFPKQADFLLEAFIGKDANSITCLEVTVGLLTHIGQYGETIYEVFEPSEVLATDMILSLEEKFLAGAGHNITPARFHTNQAKSVAISLTIKNEVARIAQALQLQGYARIDAFVKIASDGTASLWIIEVNALPAMTPATCIFHQCALNGYTPFNFIDAIIQYGFTKRHFEATSSDLTP